MTMDDINREARFKSLEERAGAIAKALNLAPFHSGTSPEDARLTEVNRVLDQAEAKLAAPAAAETGSTVDDNIPPGNQPEPEFVPEPIAAEPQGDEPNAAVEPEPTPV